ncbi:hypothetical protein UFOVP843_42 [uncultured Caudovirales phage]|uniref:Uncharacterized protein n=1 Tax=uncultured Caudovirales phage TaxID=2100421 RepID=A0A6J5PKU8_9CAUD|nr:hypothetical protein UFOVP843_42 [uncultured Caudovirales phage]CAB4172429.1 hypothetical protein UFOVP936_14 [uncultured Caudovirales phage]
MTEPVLTLTPDERQIIDFMRAHRDGGQMHIIAAGLPNALSSDGVDLKVTGIRSPAFCLTVGLGLLTYYRERCGPIVIACCARQSTIPLRSSGKTAPAASGSGTVTLIPHNDNDLSALLLLGGLIVALLIGGFSI